MEHRSTSDRHGQARGIGWEFAHICIDDCSRVAYAEVLSDENGLTVRRSCVARCAGLAGEFANFEARQHG